MNGYRMNKARILKIVIALISAAVIGIFTFEVFKGYTPLGYSKEYIEARVIRVVYYHGTDEIQCVDVAYNIGLTRFDTTLPSAVWYLDGTEVGDRF